METDNNIQQSTPQQPTPAPEAPEQQPKKKRNWGALILGGGFLQTDAVRKLIPLFVMVVFYALALVGARYQVESLTKQKLEAQDRIDFLRETRIELQKHYQETIKISQIAERLDSTGIGITAGPPFEI